MIVYTLDARPAGPHFPGIGRYVRSLVPPLIELLAPNEALQLLTLRGSAPGGLPLGGYDGRLRITPISVSNFSPGQQWQVPLALRRAGSALFHSPYYLMPYLPGRPTLLTVYDVIPLTHPEASSPRARRLFRLLHGLALRRVDRVIAISAATRRDLERYFNFPAARVQVIPLAPSPSFRPAPQAAVAALRDRLRLHRPYVLYLGINKPHKNLVRLVKAWNLVSTEALLVIAGAWDERYSDVTETIEQLGLLRRVRLQGPVAEEDLATLYSGADLFVFPSLYEGFGLPVIEAMACGTPVASSYAASLTEVGGLAAAYFNPEDPADIARTLQALLDSPRRLDQAAAAGLERAAAFSWDRTAAQTLALYRGLVSFRN